MNQHRIAVRVGGMRDESRIEGTRVGQPCAGACTALGGGSRNGMDYRSMRALDCKDDRSVRRRFERAVQLRARAAS